MNVSLLLSPDQIAENLRSAILDRELPPGMILNQSSLATRFGVSRIPLREALRTLAAEGLITNRPGVGSIVTELTPEDVAELYDIRLAIEPPLAEAIVENSSRKRLASLEQRAGEMERARLSGDRDAFSRANYRFHADLYSMAGTRYVSHFIFMAMNLVEPYSRVYLHVLHRTDRAQTEHLDMLEAIRDGDAARLRSQIETHLLGAREALMHLATFGPTEVPAAAPAESAE